MLDNAILTVLQERFLKNIKRHPGLTWETVLARLVAAPEKLQTLDKMEQSGGEPDVVGLDEHSQALVFMDCAPESPSGRRSLCYDRAALDARKENKPASSALETAAAMGIEVLTEQEYRHLQSLGEFDQKTSSWLKTPPAIRDLGGAIFGDRRYQQVFVYHNGAESYYAARGFRGCVRV